MSTVLRAPFIPLIKDEIDLRSRYHYRPDSCPEVTEQLVDVIAWHCLRLVLKSRFLRNKPILERRRLAVLKAVDDWEDGKLNGVTI